MKLWLKLVLIFVIFLVTVLGLIGGIYSCYNTEINRKVSVTRDNASFEISKGSGVNIIANELVSLGFLSRPEILKVYLSQHPDKIIQAGYYSINKKDIN